MNEASLECDNREKNLVDCSCTKEDCPRRGFCCACVAAHRKGGSLPSCLRE